LACSTACTARRRRAVWRSVFKNASTAASSGEDRLTWADSVGNADGAPSFFKDLTAWECADSSFHIEHHVPAVHVAIVDEAPVISDSDQRILLVHGLAFGLQFSRLVYALDPPSPVRCIVAANDTNATLRFHQIRHGEFGIRRTWILTGKTRRSRWTSSRIPAAKSHRPGRSLTGALLPVTGREVPMASRPRGYAQPHRRRPASTRSSGQHSRGFSKLCSRDRRRDGACPGRLKES
jgi:hypothetical protein